MTGDNREMIEELVKDWSLEMLDDHVTRLNQKKEVINEWITVIRGVMRKKERIQKKVYDTGVRGGS